MLTAEELTNCIEKADLQQARLRGSIPWSKLLAEEIEKAILAKIDARREAAMEAVTEALGDACDCTRIWSAWQVGTMSQDDFSPVAEDSDRVFEITDAVINALKGK